MKKTYVFLVILFLLISVIGCAAPKKEVEISGNVKSVGNNISVNGTTKLEGGSKIKVDLRELETDSVLQENTVKVDEEGNYGLNFSRDNKEEDQKLVVSFHPEDQTEDIKKIYGAKGENISENSTGLFQYSKEGNEYTGIQMFDFIYKVVKGSAGQRTFLLDHFEDPNVTVGGEE
jgi:type 1 fimbria pilin